MYWVRSGRRKVGGTAAVAVAIALVGHALLMAGGGHPAAAAHAGHDAPPASQARHGPARTLASSTVHSKAGVEPHPTGGDPAGDRTDGCGGLLALAWPQPQPTPSAGSAPVVPPAAVDPVVLAVAESRVVASRLDPTDPPGTRRALLQIYRI